MNSGHLSQEPAAARCVLHGSLRIPLSFLYQQLNVGRLFNQVLPSEFSKEEQQVAAEFTKTEGYYALSDEADPNRQVFL